MTEPAQQESSVRRVREAKDALDIRTLKEMKSAELTKIAVELNVDGATSLRKQELIFKMLHAPTDTSGLKVARTVIVSRPGGYELIRPHDYNYLSAPLRHF
ncbi:MAG: transcription termination factor Rho, partial [bacterium]|nr:transcription termination factor Rho [bacterium]